MKRFSPLLLPFALLVACSAESSDPAASAGGTSAAPPGGGQTGEEHARCAVTASQELGPDEPSRLGFTANGVLDAANAAEHGPLRFAKGGETALTVSLTQIDAARFEERMYQSDGSGIEIALGCDNAVVIPVTLQLTSADGSFDERWDTDYTLTTAGGGSLFLEIDRARLNGSYTLTEVDETRYESVRLLLNISVLGTTLRGSIDAQAARTSGQVASAENIPIATF